MDINKAKELSVLVARQERYSNIIDSMKSGYCDEWEFRNSHTGSSVDFSCDDWVEIRAMCMREFNDVTKKITDFK